MPDRLGARRARGRGGGRAGVPASTGRSEQVTCPSDKKALGGGGSTTGYNGKLVNSAPTNPGTGWVAAYQNTGNTPVTVYAWVICANVTS